MNLTEIFKESFSYSTQNWKKLIILGVLLLIPTIFTVVSGMNANVILVVIAAILSIVFGLIVGGYTLSVIGDTIGGSDSIPDIDFKGNFVSGLKLLVVQIVYLIFLVIIFAIILAITGGLNYLPAIFATNATASANAVAAATLASPSPLFLIGMLIIVILLIIAMFFMVVSNCRLAKTGSIKAALSWSGITEDINAIGGGRLACWYIIFLIIIMIISAIAGIINMIPIIGPIVCALIIAPFIVLFGARAMGLLYADA